MKYLCIIALMMTGSLLPAQTIPSDAAPNCPVASTTFAQWFQSGKPAVDGIVNPANSVGFTEGSTCNFYAWAKQMFLWVTSESGGARVFDSAAFYDVSPPDSSYKRTFLPHGKGSFTHSMMLRAAKGGPHDLPIIEDKSGQLFEVTKPPIDHSGKQIVVNSAGNLVEVSKASITSNHKLAFLDKAGNKIELSSAGARRSESLPADTIRTAEEFIVNGEPVFVDSSGNIIDVEQGQAGKISGVLETQKDGLVYYMTMTNDVYAYFLTGVKNHAIVAAQFPTTQTDLDQIKKYAAANGKPDFTDEQALTVELKSSWIEVTDAAKKDYITTTAIIPIYDRSDPKKWVVAGQKKATLGLLGLHIVGSVKGHPEMIWATFERFGNTPNAAYSYTNTKQETVSVPQSTAGSWLFSTTNSTVQPNVAHMTAEEANIIAAAGQTISPSDSLRIYAWGAGSLNASANSNLISIHNSVNALMPTGDIRSDYFLVGATWTTGGTAPPVGTTGSTNVANSTMETYTQVKGGCFQCHTGSLAPGTISHIFGGDTNGLQPLFPASSGN